MTCLTVMGMLCIAITLRVAKTHMQQRSMHCSVIDILPTVQSVRP